MFLCTAFRSLQPPSKACLKQSTFRLYLAPQPPSTLTRQSFRGYSTRQQQAFRRTPMLRLLFSVTRKPVQQPLRCSSYFTREARKTWHVLKVTFFEHPFQVTLALSGIFMCFVLFVLYVRYHLRVITPLSAVYPEPVLKQLKRALYYTNIDHNPVKATQYFKRCFDAAHEMGVSSASAEMIDIKWIMAGMLCKFDQYHAAIMVLKSVDHDCYMWNAKINRDAKNLHRTRLLRARIAACCKIGEYAAHELVNDMEMAEEYFISATQLSLAEMDRREREGVGENEGEFITQEAVANTLENLADTFEAKSNHALAAPLYLRAVTLMPKSCHTAVLMNNLASSLAQTLPEQAAGVAQVGAAEVPAMSRDMLIQSARAWAEKAIRMTAAIPPPERTEECEVGCAVATHNLGEFAEMEGLVEEARKMYVEAESLAKAIKFSEGVDNAKAGLKRLEKKAGGGVEIRNG